MSRIAIRAAVATALLAAGLVPALAADTGSGSSPTTHTDHPASQTPTTWDLDDLYASPAAWQSAYDQTQQRIDTLSRFSGHLTDSADALAKALNTISDVQKSVARLSVYAGLAADQDLRDSHAQERRNKADRLAAQFGEATGYVRPELVAMDQDKLKSWSHETVLADYQYMLMQIMKAAPHTLSRQTESALAALSPVNGQNDTFSLLSNADIQWPKIKIDGKERTIDQAGYTKWRSNPNREVRKRVFKAFWSKYNQYESTFGSLLDQTVLQHVIDARLHHYDSALAAATAANDIPTSVYHQLVASVNDNLDTLHRYLKLRARMLGVKQLHYYDIYPPLVKSDRAFTIDEARSLVRRATRPLGAHYEQLLDKATNSPWTSVYPSPGKSSGAYMNGAAYDVHPYVLMNFNDDYESVSTYAHEWGHGVHTMLADERQPFATADYPIFTAEVASTTNEQLLVHYMIEHAKTDEAKLFYIGQALEQLRGTFFRQAQFAEFELAIHQAVQKGEPLSGARLTRMYGDILDKYYGTQDGITQIDPADDIEWAYIPHFYYDFYVYQYATSITAAHYFASHIEQGDAKVRKAYLHALSEGGADSGYTILKNAGVDLATAAPYQALMAYMNGLMDQANAILDKQTDNHEKDAG
ncbi:oligoendopeptidase F [Salinisphaera hydrothermalis]|uniref:Oligopeptidase F n=1 Tax=Salinisphaera hydrothermalis (strain C41B8) TaxID=1304275 RepID=A0A084IM29_SALHC|nr:oligoendopeptidase F [Salinisphaera hydrothermalis]KEZ77763.1 oligoendopeptidase F [Salinisphaera hydrothermalis C41B8]